MYKLADVNAEYEKDPKLKREDIKNLKEWVEKQPHLPQITELQLILFLQSCYYSNEKAKSAIDNFFTTRTLFKDLFSNLNPHSPSVQMAIDVGLGWILPETTPNGQKALILKLMDTNPNKYVFADQLKRFDMMLTLYMHLNGTNKGINIVFDFDGSSLSHLLKVSPSVVKKSLFYLQEALPIRLKQVHVINVPTWIDKVMALIKPFLKKELLDMIHIHTAMDTLYESVPQEILPKDYGGTVEATVDLQEKLRTFLEENGEFFEDLEKQVTNESKRTDKNTNYNKIFGMEGTFKKLEVD